MLHMMGEKQFHKEHVGKPLSRQLHASATEHNDQRIKHLTEETLQLATYRNYTEGETLVECGRSKSAQNPLLS